MEIDRSTNSKELLLTKVYSVSQYLSCYSEVKTTIFQEKKIRMQTVFHDSVIEYFMKKIIWSRAERDNCEREVIPTRVCFAMFAKVESALYTS